MSVRFSHLLQVDFSQWHGFSNPCKWPTCQLFLFPDLNIFVKWAHKSNKSLRLKLSFNFQQSVIHSRIKRSHCTWLNVFFFTNRLSSIYKTEIHFKFVSKCKKVHSFNAKVCPIKTELCVTVTGGGTKGSQGYLSGLILNFPKSKNLTKKIYDIW